MNGTHNANKLILPGKNQSLSFKKESSKLFSLKGTQLIHKDMKKVE
jgi:hypothetical protein